MTRRTIMLGILVVVCVLFGQKSNAKDFTPESEKALIVFAVKSTPYDVLLNVVGINASDGKTSMKNGFNVIIGKGTPLFGPHSATYNVETSKDIKLQKKKVKPGTYMMINGNGGPSGSMGKGGTGCFASDTKLFTVEAGKVYLITVPNGKPNKPGKEMDWNLDPNVSDDELLDVYKSYLENNPKIRADIGILPFKKVRFEPRKKFGNCFPPKSGHFEIIAP